MNRARLQSKPVRAILMVSAAVLLAGCASHYPYSGGNGVYYGKSYDRYGHGYNRHYGHTGYQYNYYRRDYVHRFVPWWSGYGSYHHGYRRHDSGRHHDHRDDHHDRDTADRSGDAARELQRVTDQQRRRALLQRNDSRSTTTVRSDSSSRSAPERSVNRSPTNTNSAREQLRRVSPNRSDESSGSGSTIRSGARSDSSHRGGVRTPRKRDR